MKKSYKIILSLLVTLVVLLFGASTLSYVFLKSSLPDYDGEVLVNNNLTDNVEIYRDSIGVVYINSSTENDAAFALGYAHAQDRLFQMDLIRRAGQGRLSEVLGNKTVLFDKMFRTLGMYKTVVNHYPTMDDKNKNLLISYSNGVNEFINNNSSSYSVEFDLLGYDPEPWQPEHSLVISKLMAWELNISWWTDFIFTKLLQEFGEEKVKKILPDYPENAPYIIPNKNSFANFDGLFQLEKERRKFWGQTGTHIGSNNWVVNGEKSNSGKPIIANDPHLSFQVPGKWYVAVIRSNGWNAEGFTLPGIPGIVIGKNKNISWVLTNVMTDDSDFYFETIDSSGQNYLLDEKWDGLEIIKDTIHVKDSSDYVYEIKKTHRGPIVSDVHTYNLLNKNSSKISSPISMKWAALDFSDEFKSIQLINRANNWNDFDEALKYYSAPGQNFVYADNQGNIGYICGSKIPIRKNNSPTFIMDGSTTDNDWNGYVDYKRMPKLFNPKENYIASANNKTVKEFKYHITNLWEPPSRIKRIKELLEAKEEHGVNDFKKYQSDFYSHYAKELLEHLLRAFENVELTDENLKTSLTIIKQWDYILDEQSQVPTIYTVFLQKLLENILADEMGIELLKEYVFLGNIPYKVVMQLLNSDDTDWIDDINTNTIEDKNYILRKSLSDTLEELEKYFGNDISQWQWGKIHTIKFNHYFNGASPMLDPLINVGPMPIGGDGTTIFNTEYSFNKSFKIDDDANEAYKNILGPSMRFLYDFADSNSFMFVTPTGQSGHILGENYSNTTDHWISGKYFKVSFDNSINSFYKNKLTLVTGN